MFYAYHGLKPTFQNLADRDEARYPWIVFVSYGRLVEFRILVITTRTLLYHGLEPADPGPWLNSSVRSICLFLFLFYPSLVRSTPY